VKPFHFTLAALQTLRERAEQRAEEQYGRALRNREQAIRQRDEVQRQLESGWATSQQELEAGVPQAQWAHTQAYCQQTVTRLRTCQVSVESAQAAANQCLQQLLQAQRDREVVDKYYQNQRRSYAHAEQREEQKMLDDLAGRRGRGGERIADQTGRSAQL
jgi:flagellar export protein FliJ